MKHIHLDKVSSTQTYLMNDHSLFTGNTLISCNTQESGYGRHERVWDDFTESLCFSFSLTPNETLTLTPLEIAVSICHFFQKSFQTELSLKWPNDILRDGKKCGGILINNIGEKRLAVGVGLNINPQHNFNNYKTVATSIFSKEILFKKSDMALQLYQYILDNRLSPQFTIKKWNQKCAHMNKDVVIEDINQKTGGLFVGIGQFGQACIQEGNQVKELYSGSLTLLTPL